MNIHKNARLTPQGRLLLVERMTAAGRSVVQAALAAGISVRQSYRWLARYRAEGAAGLADRSSAPHRCQHRTAGDRVGEIERLRRQRMSGPQIARQLSMARSDRRQATGALTSATWRARAADRAWLCLSRSDCAVLKYGPTEILPPVGPMLPRPAVSADRGARPGPHTRGKPRLLDVGRRIPARDRFAPDSPLEETGFEPWVLIAKSAIFQP